MAADAYNVSFDRFPANVHQFSSGRQAVVVVPSDTLDLPNASNASPTAFYAKALWVGNATSCNVAVIMAGDKSNGGAGTAVTFQGVPPGSQITHQIRRVMATGTSATAGTILAITD